MALGPTDYCLPLSDIITYLASADSI